MPCFGKKRKMLYLTVHFCVLCSKYMHSQHMQHSCQELTKGTENYNSINQLLLFNLCLWMPQLFKLSGRYRSNQELKSICCYGMLRYILACILQLFFVVMWVYCLQSHFPSRILIFESINLFLYLVISR